MLTQSRAFGRLNAEWGKGPGGREAAQQPRGRPNVRRYPRPRRKSIAFTQVMPSSDEGGAASSVTTVFG